jgi:hypothetical protein
LCGAERGDNDLPAARATRIVVDAMAVRLEGALQSEDKEQVSELVAVDKLYKQCKRHSKDLEQFGDLKQLRERLFAAAQAQVDALLEGQEWETVKKESAPH